MEFESNVSPLLWFAGSCGFYAYLIVRSPSYRTALVRWFRFEDPLGVDVWRRHWRKQVSFFGFSILLLFTLKFLEPLYVVEKANG